MKRKFTKYPSKVEACNKVTVSTQISQEDYQLAETSADFDTLYRLFDLGDYEIYLRLADNPNIPSELLENLFKQSFKYIKGEPRDYILNRIASNPSTPDSLLRKIADLGYVDPSTYAANNPNASWDTLTMISKHPHSYVSQFARKKLDNYYGNVNACDKVTASTIPTDDIEFLAKEALNCNTRDELSSVIGSLLSIDKKLYLHYMEMLRDDSLSVGYIAGQLSDELMSYYVDDVNACDKVMASSYPDGPEFNRICEQYASLDPQIPLEDIWDMVNADLGNEDGLADDVTAYVEHYRYCEEHGLDPDDIDACDNITASDHRYSAGRIEDDGTEDFYYDTGFDSYDEACDWGNNHDCTHIYDREKDEFTPINSCDTKYFANMVSASNDPELDDDFLIEGYYDNQRRGLAESAETSDVSALNELANEYANKGYYIVVHNLTDGVITEFSADNWFNDIAPDGGATLFMSW